MRDILNQISLWIIPAFIMIVLIFAAVKKVPAYETFVDGAKEGLFVSIRILPYLVAIIVCVSMLRASGAIDILAEFFKEPLQFFKVPPDALPLMITRSISGSATLGIFSDIVDANGANSYAAKLSAIIVGSSETTFYVLAVYFGSVGIKKVRFALLSGLLADLFGIIAAVAVARYFFLQG